MIELRMRSKRSDEWADKYKGAQVTPEMVNVRLEGPARVLMPNGRPLCVYLPKAALDVGDATYEEFSRIRVTNRNRGAASGGATQKGAPGSGPTRWGSLVPVTSTSLGSLDYTPGRSSYPYCRLTAFSSQQVERWEALLPYFDRISALFAENVPERYAAQMQEVERTDPDWVIKGTPFTTITVNNTYPTGIHTDKGDLDAGFSTLGCIRRGSFTGGWLTFPQFGVAADMQNGDVLLMDAHQWHGNTPIQCAYCEEQLRKPGHTCANTPNGKHGPERISVVSYFRTNMVACGSMGDENERRAALQEKRAAKALGLEDGA